MRVHSWRCIHFEAGACGSLLVDRSVRAACAPPAAHRAPRETGRKRERVAQRRTSKTSQEEIRLLGCVLPVLFHSELWAPASRPPRGMDGWTKGWIGLGWTGLAWMAGWSTCVFAHAWLSIFFATFRAKWQCLVGQARVQSTGWVISASARCVLTTTQQSPIRVSLQRLPLSATLCFPPVLFFSLFEVTLHGVELDSHESRR